MNVTWTDWKTSSLAVQWLSAFPLLVTKSLLIWVNKDEIILYNIKKISKYTYLKMTMHVYNDCQYHDNLSHSFLPKYHHRLLCEIKMRIVNTQTWHNPTSYIRKRGKLWSNNRKICCLFHHSAVWPTFRDTTIFYARQPASFPYSWTTTWLINC